MYTQWRNRQRDRVAPPKTSDREISADHPGKERQGKQGKWRRKEGKWKKGKVKKKAENWKWKEGKLQSDHRTLFFFVCVCVCVCVFFLFFVFIIIIIMFIIIIIIIIILFIYFFIDLFISFFFFCFSLLKSTEICFGSTTMGIFTGEKIRKNDFAHSEKYSSHAPVCTHFFESANFCYSRPRGVVGLARGSYEWSKKSKPRLLY